MKEVYIIRNFVFNTYLHKNEKFLPMDSYAVEEIKDFNTYMEAFHALHFIKSEGHYQIEKLFVK
jgi:hypothetical protein